MEKRPVCPEGGCAHLLVSTAEMAFICFSPLTGPPARRPSHYSPGTKALVATFAATQTNYSY